jgi:hypothetical protein
MGKEISVTQYVDSDGNRELVNVRADLKSGATFTTRDFYAYYDFTNPDASIVSSESSADFFCSSFAADVSTNSLSGLIDSYNSLADSAVSKEVPLSVRPDWSQTDLRQFKIYDGSRAYSLYIDSADGALRYITLDGETFIIEVSNGFQERTFTDADFSRYNSCTAVEGKKQVNPIRFKGYTGRKAFP